jgi:PHD/YefM family antitoxin component YafN of YafNO toxin-antitoxin module
MNMGVSACSQRCWPRVNVMLLLTLALSGCGGRGSVTGTVTYKNKPVPFGQVLFEGSDGASRQSNIDKNGKFFIEDVATGEAKVAVMSPNPKSITVLTKGNKKAESFAEVPNWIALPAKYEAVAKSGLTFPIKKGENTINIDLK